MSFGKYVDDHRIKVKNKPNIFGNQLVLDSEDNIVAEEEFLLINATDISIESVSEIVTSYNGVCYPAHIDRDANGIVAILGTIPDNDDFTLYELHDGGRADEFSARFGIDKSNFIISSDAHYLTDMKDKENFFILDDEPYSSARVTRELFQMLRGKFI